nr:MAG: glycyl-tRNA synthetase [Candidatus Nanosalinarum sp. J07AB56]
MSQSLRELAKRRGLFFISQGSYGGSAGFYTFGPVGNEVKNNIVEEWRDVFVRGLGNMEIDAPTVMKEDVFQASGHVDTFDDMILECPNCGRSHRGDHLVEDETELEEAEGLPTEKIEELVEENDIGCPSCGEALAGVEVSEFNLMFDTDIGPGDSETGYLRPETAQGIFVDFPRLKQYARNQLPFGVAQVGRGYRNEISPRGGLSRVREFTMAELEQFILEGQKPELSEVEDVTLRILSREMQENGETPADMTPVEAVEDGVVESEWIAYFLGRAQTFYERIGIHPGRLRFRQHQADELSHYASDCWDAETDVGSEGRDWLEVTGFAFRGCYDLKKHHEHSESDYTVFREFDEPREVEEISVDPDMSWLGPELGDGAEKAVERLQELAESEPERFEKQSSVEIENGSGTMGIPVDKTGFSRETVEKNGEHVLPQVVEPSFGIGRLVYSVLTHSLDTDEVDGEERTLLRLPSEVAPADVAVLPLMDRDGLTDRAREVASTLRNKGLEVRFDSSGSIGRRYRRMDEIGVPLCVTVDYGTLGEEEETEKNTVTLRDRDTTEQERTDISELADRLA